MITMLATLVTFACGNAMARDCRVADPTGTPLNIRMQPNGKFVASIAMEN